MNNRYALALTLSSLLTLTSCTDASKETPAQSVKRVGSHGSVKHFEDLITRGGNAVDTLNETVKNNPKVVLDFYAEWCGPCKRLSPVLDEVAAEYTDVLFVKINVDTYESLSDKFAVKGIPALFFYKDGNLVERAGSMSKSDLKKKLSKLD